MWVLVVGKSGRELMRASVRSGMVLIGRSPVCDIVLRAPGIQSVHFLLEWIGEGDPKPGPDDWTVFDLSSSVKGLSEKQSAQSGTGEGQILTSNKTTIGGFEFHWVEDRLQETVLTGGIISSQVREKAQQSESSPLSMQIRRTVVEAIEVDSERESVTEISHLSILRQKRPVRPFISALPLIVRFEQAPAPRAKVILPQDSGVQVFNRGVPVAKEAELTVGPGDIYQINWKMKEYYFRLVPEIQVPVVPRQITKDPLYRWFLALTIFFLLLTLLLKMMERPPEVLPEEPPRVAKIEIREIPPPPPELPEQPPPEPKPEPPPPEPVKQAKPQPQLPEATPVKDGQKAPHLKPIDRKDQTTKEQKGLNTKAPSGPVNAMGLLGAIKSKGKQNQIKADKVINEGIIGKRVTGDQGKFTIQQPPMGVIGPKDKAGSPTSLTAASTTLKVGDSSDTGSLAQIAGGKGAKGDVPQYEVSFKGDDSEGQSVEGGLDRDTVFKTIQAYRRELRACYEKALLTKPRLRGRMVFKWQISPQGVTQNARLERSELDHRTFENCTKEVIQLIRWPKAPNGRPTIVRYPFEFQKKN